MAGVRPAAPRGLCVFDLDQTLLDGRTLLHLGQRFELVSEIQAIWAQDAEDELAAGPRQSARLAALFKGIPVSEIEAACRAMPLRTGARRTINALRKLGFVVGVASATYDVATRVQQQRLGLDLHAGARMEVRDGTITGLLLPMEFPDGDCRRLVCKEQVLKTWAQQVGAPLTVAVGDGANDECLLRRADVSIALEPAHPLARAAAHHVVADLRRVPEIVSEVLQKHTSTAITP